MKIKLYSHMNDSLGGMEITKQQLEKIKKSGLIDSAEIFYFTNFNPDNYSWLKEDLKDYTNINYMDISADPIEWEISTLSTIKSHCDELDEECYIGYIHHKGVTHFGRPSEKYVTEWREMLEYFVIEKWQEAIQLLEEYEIAGVNWKEEPWPHFSGNFWWARSSYIKRLPKIRRPKELGVYGRSQFGTYTKGWEYQYDAEVWSGMGSPKLYNLHTSGVDHYKQSYPAILYRQDVPVKFFMK